MLTRAAAETGGVATQNRGTLGGNIANGSPAADSPPALLVYDAELELNLGPRIAPGACRTTASTPATRRWTSRPTSSFAPSRFREGGGAGSSPTARSARARRRRSRKSALPPPRLSTAMSCAMPASRSAASRPRSCAACTPKRRSVAGRLQTTWPPRPGRRWPATSPRIDDVRSTARYRLRVAENLLIQFLMETLRGR